MKHIARCATDSMAVANMGGVGWLPQSVADTVARHSEMTKIWAATSRNFLEHLLR